MDSCCQSSTGTGCGFRPLLAAPYPQSAGLESSNGGPDRCVALLLPLDVSRRVFSQLDYRDLVHCSLVCKQWLLESTELRHGWKEEYREACSVRGVHFGIDNEPPRLPRFELYLAGMAPDSKPVKNPMFKDDVSM